MNYELAKKLKNAGFKQKKLSITGVYAGVCEHGTYGFSSGRESCNCGEEETVHFPTLSELIEACGENVVTLRNELGGVWTATDEISIKSQGKTLEEAVANLWLALQENKQTQ